MQLSTESITSRDTLMRHFAIMGNAPKTPNKWARLAGDVLRTYVIRSERTVASIEQELGFDRGTMAILQNGVLGGVATSEHWYKVLRFFGMKNIRELMPEIDPEDPKLLMYMCIQELYKDGMEGLDKYAFDLFSDVPTIFENVRDIGKGKNVSILEKLMLGLFGVDSRREEKFDATEWFSFMYSRITGSESDKFDEEDAKEL